MTDMIRTFMLGAILGDIAGSRYERDNIKHMPETLTKRTTMTGWTKDQNQPASR